MALSSITKNVNIVIRKNRQIEKEKIQSWLNSLNVVFYAFIEHKDDINLEGIKEGCHYHIVFQLVKRTRLSTILSNCVDYLDLRNANGIEIQICKSFEGSIQYLIHKNDALKTPHSKKEIITNLSNDELDTYLLTESDAITFDKVNNIIVNAHTILDVIREVGFTRYNMYRNSIIDMWKVLKERA